MRRNTQSDRLQDNLKRLKLTQAAEMLDTVVAQAEDEKGSYLSFLDQLLEEEVAAKEKRRVQTAMKTAGLPSAKTIEEYDFTFHPKLNKKEVMALFDLDFIGKQENVIFLGPPGCRQNPSGHIAGHQGLPSRFQGVLYHHGYVDEKAQGTPIPA
ncbi:hypothetical protein DSCA_11900 [Desulfosarcina alkanivorans]|uniref:IstB-like ATP-binding domain-containing protein n=2 Tax=Desulfosarcina alkanivorans TaxID=571177 RepID=A0A5K7YGM1_9BACT|nr:hypothetical protein DSCA_11900 [Desulfosarcina alkanivorans]